MENKIRAILKKYIAKRGLRGDIKDTESLISNGIIDSLGAIEVISLLENAFGIKIAPEEMTEANFDSVVKMADFIRQKIKK